jgi:hypothetical protein
MQKQNKYDQMPSVLLDRLQRISFFADKVAHKIVCEETEMLEKTIPVMFKVMQMVAKFLCDYVKRGRFGKQSKFLDSATTDDDSENGGRAGPPGEN